MAGVTVLELLVCCLFVLALGGVGSSYVQKAKNAHSAEVCLDSIESFLGHARARSVLSREDSQVRFDLNKSSLQGNWTTPMLELPSSCGLRAAGFGVAGKKAPLAVFYPTGSASPGMVLVTGAFNDWCRLTIGIRGGRSKQCS